MEQFNSHYESHEHSLQTLQLVREYDDFLDSLSVIADMGCGYGLDIEWFATLTDRQEEPQPYNYTCYAVDKDILKIKRKLPSNVIPIEKDFSERCIPRSIDWIWCHDAFQYSTNPLQTLKTWNEQMTPNGMLTIILPQSYGYLYNRLVKRSYNHVFFEYNVCNLIYMLAVNGFDCKDSYVKKLPNDPWIYISAYKSDISPMIPEKTTWYDLIDANLLHDSIANSIKNYGFLRQEDILMPWLDKNLYFVSD